MKKITVCKCDFCGKLLVNVTQMKNHENKLCFYNPESKSCATCDNLDLETVRNGELLSKRESNIMQYKIEGTYHTVTGYMESDNYELNDEYKYLYECDTENYCIAKKQLLKKLTTNCNRHLPRNE